MFVGNLAWSVTSETLTQFFVNAGYAVSAEVMMHPDGRSKGWALVTFDQNTSSIFSSPGMEAAIAQLNDVELEGRKLLLRPEGERGGKGARGGKGRGGGKGSKEEGGGGGRGGARASPAAHELTAGNVLFVGNLPWSTTSETLRETFAPFGVVSAEVKMGYSGRSRGYGIVELESETNAASALSLNDAEIDGRPMLVRYERAPAA